MRSAGIDTVLVTSPVDVGYLTGFLGGDSYLIVGKGKPTMVSDSRYEEDLQAVAHLVRIKMRTGAISPVVAQFAADLRAAGRLERLGYQAEHLTLHQLDMLKAALRKAGVKQSTLTPTSGLVADLRRVKDEHEVGLISRALRIQQDALVATLETIKPGQTELDVCARLEFEMKTRGSSDPSFATIVGAQSNGSRPHYSPAKTRLRKNTPLLIDWGATYSGYHGDMTRTFALGKWPKQVREIYGIVLDAHERAAASLGPGVRCVEVDAAARDHIDAAGYGAQFGHGLGHGVGMNVHEGPSLSRHSGKAQLEPGNIVTIEPGIYLPGIGGVRIEDMYLITDRGARNLSRLPKDIGWATL